MVLSKPSTTLHSSFLIPWFNIHAFASSKLLHYKLFSLQPWYAHGIAEAIMRTANLSVPLKVRVLFLIICQRTFHYFIWQFAYAVGVDAYCF